MTTLAVRANEFLAQRRIALVGVSRDPRDLSRTLFRELRRRGYDVVPVNPELGVGRRRTVPPQAPRRQSRSRRGAPDDAARGDRAGGTRLRRGRRRARVDAPWRGPGRGEPDGRSLTAAITESPSWRAPAPSCSCPVPALVHRGHGFLARLFGRHPGPHAA